MSYREQSEFDVREIGRARDLPPDEPYGGEDCWEPPPPCPACGELDGAYVYDAVEFVGFHCESCGFDWNPNRGTIRDDVT